MPYTSSKACLKEGEAYINYLLQGSGLSRFETEKDMENAEVFLRLTELEYGL